MKYVIVIACLLLTGCNDWDAFREACEAKGGEAFWLRNERALCLRKDVVIPLRKAGYQ